jgi:O-antigen/teichoic acid export membrane protein
VNPTVWVAIGLGVFGLSNFVLLGFTGRDLGPAGSAPVSVTWTFMNAIGIGLFMPLEQEVGRRTSAAVAGGEDPDGIADVIRYVRWSLAAVLVVGCAGSALIARVFLSGNVGLTLLLVAGLMAMALEYLCRGILSGTGRFRRYGAQLATDGAVRMGLSALIFVSPVESAAAYGAVMVASPLVATAATAPLAFLRSGVLGRQPAHRWPMGALVATSVSSQLLANSGPLIIAALASDAQADAAGNFVAANTVARMPLFLFAAVQAVYLPALSAGVGRRDRSAFASTARKGAALTGTLALAGGILVAAVGMWVIRLIYGEEFFIPSGDLALLALSGALFMGAQFLAQLLLALRADGAVVLGWVLGIAGTGLALLLPLDLTTLVAVALCVGATAAASTFALAAPPAVAHQRWREAAR